MKNTCNTCNLSTKIEYKDSPQKLDIYCNLFHCYRSPEADCIQEFRTEKTLAEKLAEDDDDDEGDFCYNRFLNG